MLFQQTTASSAESRNWVSWSPAPLTAGRHQIGPPSESSPAPLHRPGGLGLFPVLVLSVLAFFAVSALETFSINPDRPAAILFPEALSQDQAFAAIVAAGGLPIRPMRSALTDGIVWIAAAGSPDFFDRVTSHGAWAVINPFAFGGCFLVTPA